MSSVSLKTIANRIGVTDATVSMALRDHPRISAQRKEQVRKLARELGYNPNPLAAGLRGGRTRSIGLLWSLGDWNGAYTMRKVVDRFRSAGYVSYLSDHYSESQRVQEYLEDLLHRGADGVVILISDEESLHRPRVLSLIRQFKFRLLVTNKPVAFDQADVVVRERGEAIRNATHHLLRTGRRRLAYVLYQGPGNEQKVQACQEVVRELGRGQVVTVAVQGQELDDVIQAMNDSAAARQAQGMLFSSDKLALAGLRWLERTGRVCPDDVAVIGFDDTEFAPMLSPPLASVNRSGDELAATIADLLTHRMANPDAAFQEKWVPMRFVWRASAGGPPPEPANLSRP